MLLVFITTAIGLLLIGLSELARRRGKIDNEIARKTIHIMHAVIVAFWPYFVSYKFIIVAEVLFLASVLIARQLKLFDWLRDVNRFSWGEFFFPLGVIICALLTPPAWVFALSLLHLGIADGLAAIVGSHFGKKTAFKIFSYQKSLVGALTFWASSVLIVGAFALTHQSELTGAIWPLMLILPIKLAVLESVSVWGTDNVVVPVAALLFVNTMI